jgi:hypothetical protein
MPIPAVVGAAIIGGGASLIGAGLSSRSAGQAAQATTDAANQNNATQLQIYNQQRADSEPWRQFGLQALGQLSTLYNFNWQPSAAMQQPTWQQPQTGGGGTSQGGVGGGGGGYNTGGGGLIGNLLNPQTPGNNPTGLPTPLADDVSVLSSGSSDGGINALMAAQGAPGADGQPMLNGGPNASGQTDPGAPLIAGGGGDGYGGVQTMTGTGQPGVQPMTPGQPGLNTTPFFASPDYQFRLNEGNRNLTNAFANTGNLDSGAAQRALLRYGQDTASGEWNNYVNRLASFSGVGQTVNQSNNALAQGYANNVQANNNMAAQGRASAYQQQGQAWQQGLGGAAGAGMWAFNNWGGGK